MPIGNTAARVLPCCDATTPSSHLETEILLHIIEKILAVLVGLESDQVVGQHRLDQFAMMRHAADHGARRPGCMEEETDRLRHAEIAQLRAEREEMIILNPERRVGLCESQQRARHEGVHFAIGEIVLLRRANQIGARMQRRPQRRIGKALVIAAVMRGRQIEHRQRAGAERLDFGERFLLVPVTDAARGTHPDGAGILHHRQQRSRQSPGHGFVGLCRARRGLKRRRGSQGPLLLGHSR